MNPDILFTPFTSPKLTLKNRVAMAPMTRQFSPDGIPDDTVLQYYKRRAEHDVGLIITEGTTGESQGGVERSTYPRLSR
jgi:2,4-dienoyl-CoA reductase-like NADH-dependent reductase (Old Yellow Enzyme family)